MIFHGISARFFIVLSNSVPDQRHWEILKYDSQAKLTKNYFCFMIRASFSCDRITPKQGISLHSLSLW